MFSSTKLLLSMLLVLFNTGCVFSAASMTSIVSAEASKEFNCPEDQVDTKMNDDKTVFAKGCGESANYGCFHSGPWHEAQVLKPNAPTSLRSWRSAT